MNQKSRGTNPKKCSQVNQHTIPQQEVNTFSGDLVLLFLTIAYCLCLKWSVFICTSQIWWLLCVILLYCLALLFFSCICKIILYKKCLCLCMQMTGCCCWKFSKPCNNLIFQFHSSKQIPKWTLTNSKTMLLLSSFSFVINLLSGQVPAMAAYLLCAFCGAQVLFGILKIKKLDQQERLITGTAWHASFSCIASSACILVFSFCAS